MARLTEESKAHNEAAIRTAMERILKGELPPDRVQARAISRLVAQHNEIERLRKQAATDHNVRRPSAAVSGSAPFGSGS
jgi:hypothetical protein